MRWGLIGGGKGSQIGGAHRMASRLDGLFVPTAAALDVDPQRGRDYAIEVGFDPARSYGTWQELLAAESQRPAGERLDLVTVATPNVTHYAISRALLEAGFNVLCEKPLTMTVEEAEELGRIAAAGNAILGVNFGYSGYPMAIQAREMIRRGDLGDFRVVVVEFAFGWHAAGDDADNPRVRWRYDPAQAGISSIVADVGSHAFQMAQFLSGRRVTGLSADFAHCVAHRRLEDDALIAFRLEGGAVGRLWVSAVATGQIHGFGIRVFGSKGGLRWQQEQPNQLTWSPIGEPTRTLERSDAGLYPESDAGARITVGHPEGFVGAFANIYKGLHRAIRQARGEAVDGPALGFPPVQDGIDAVRLVHAAVRSAELRGAWVDPQTIQPM
ncbi:MAG: Gfo/Idh/MocA family oxidoreductase [Alphaproteobacteria bacterium]